MIIRGLKYVCRQIKWDFQGRCLNCGAKNWIDIEHDRRPGTGEHYKHATCGECGRKQTWDLLPEFR